MLHLMIGCLWVFLFSYTCTQTKLPVPTFSQHPFRKSLLLYHYQLPVSPFGLKMCVYIHTVAISQADSVMLAILFLNEGRKKTKKV